MTAATVAIIINTRLNQTTTTTRFVVLPSGTELPPMNEQGTRIETITVPDRLGIGQITTTMYDAPETERNVLGVIG